MLRFDQANRRFNYRVAAVAIHNGSILLHRAGDEPFWTLPGGRAEHGETAVQTIKREMLEELETDVQVDRLLWVVENFFEYEGLSYHEFALYFLIRFPHDAAALRREAFAGSDRNVPLRFRWFPVRRDELEELPLLPAFLARGLTDLPRSVAHVVERNTVATSTSM